MSTIAFIFPGQGSQSVGMLATFSDSNLVQQTFKTASDVLGFDLWEMTQSGPQEQLDLTENTQPALLAASYALWQLWCERSKLRPQQMAGHSLGEYSALTCAGILDFKDAIRIVRRRGELMQSAVTVGQGAMAAIIGLSRDAVADVCEQAAEGKLVNAANFNAHVQTVISGETEAVLRAIELAKSKGAKIAKQIPVSVPSHSLLMKPAAEQLAAEIEAVNFHAPNYEVVNNVDVRIETDPQAIKSALLRQLYSPVRWVDIIERLAKTHDSFIECGPGNVLSKLIRREKKDKFATTIGTIELLETAIQQCA